MPDARKKRYMEVCGLSEKDANQLVASKEVSEFYDEVCTYSKEYKLNANWVLTELLAVLNKENLTMAQNPCRADYLGEMILMIKNGEISGKQAKIVFEEIIKGKDPKQVVEEKGMKQMSDAGALLSLIQTVLDQNPQSIEDFKNGKDRAVGYLVGQVMKASRGQANPAMTNQLIQEELKKR